MATRDMSIQDRYDEIAALSGLSEEIVRRVFKATRQSTVKSIKNGQKVTIPGLVTYTPELKTRLEIGGTSVKTYIDVKAKVSSALRSDLEKIGSFEDKESKAAEKELEIERLNKLNLKDPELPRYNTSNVITTQISALV